MIYRACGAVAVVLFLTTGAAQAGDLVLSKNETNPLTVNEVGKPFWSMQAQCGGVFQAGYKYKLAKHTRLRGEQAEAKHLLDRSVARLKADRGLSDDEALALVTNEFNYGQSRAQTLLASHGDGPYSRWNVARSACYEIDEAERVASR
ncbi:MAG: hypothetical protein ACXW3D_01095 [Caulobacteraceae bacterium]